jgi:uncharacterized protein
LSVVSPNARARAGRPRGPLRFLLLVVVLAVGLQIPLLAALAHLGGRLAPVVPLPALLTIAFIGGMTRGRTAWATPGRLRLYLVMWPFFIWWTAAMLFSFAAPLAMAIAAVFHGSTDTALIAALIAAVGGTALSLHQYPRVRQRDVEIEGLPESFDGYRIVQISDLHCGPFADGARVDRWVAEVNRLGADLVAVTGDLIASGSTFVPVVAASLGKLRGRDGVFACMGNHDYFTDGEEMAAALERQGLTLLRNRGVEVRRGGGGIYVAGVDDTWTRRNDLDAALAGRPEGAPVLLLAHDPALFPDAAERGVALTLSGHTHGGQLGVPFFAKRFNLARSITRFTTGLYQIGAATLYVTRGLGTTGIPIRLSVPAEIALLTLRRAPAADATRAPERADVGLPDRLARA